MPKATMRKAMRKPIIEMAVRPALPVAKFDRPFQPRDCPSVHSEGTPSRLALKRFQ